MRARRARAESGPESRSYSDDTGQAFSYRGGELLVAAEDAGLVVDALRREQARFVRNVAGMLVFRAPAHADVPRLIQRLRACEGSPSVHPNHMLSAAYHAQWDPEGPPEPADRPLDPLPNGELLAGSDVRVGVVDTGLDERSWFQGRAKPAGKRDREEPDQDRDGALDYDAGHGTHVAGIVLQHAPGSKVYVRRVVDSHGHLDDASTAAAILELVGVHHIDILNLSFGGYTEQEAGLPSTQRAISAARKINPELIVVAAAGNDGLRRPSFPAAYANVIAVGALDADGNQAEFSNYGSDWVDCCSRGVDIVSTYLDWNGAVDRRPHHDEEDGHLGPSSEVDYRHFEGFARWSGTSFAAPRVAGALAAAISPEGEGRRYRPEEAVYRVIREPKLARSDDMGTIVNPRNYVGKSSD